MSLARFVEQATPSTPPATTVYIYPKADGSMYSMDDTGVERALTSPLTTKGDVQVHDGTVVARLAVGTNDFVLLADSTAGSGLRYAAIFGTTGITVDGGGSTLTTGLKGFVTCPFNGTITGWDLIANAVGSIVFDVWKVNNAVPTVANTITASAKPTLSSSQQTQSTTLTGWTTSVTAGDVFGFNIDSVATITRVTLNIRIRKK